MIENVEATTIGKLAGGLVAGLLAAAYTFQKFSKGFTSDRAETNVIDILRAQVNQMAAHNSVLQTAMNDLQSQQLSLHGEIQHLTVENGRLQAQVERLTEEIAELRSETQPPSGVHE